MSHHPGISTALRLVLINSNALDSRFFDGDLRKIIRDRATNDIIQRIEFDTWDCGREIVTSILSLLTPEDYIARQSIAWSQSVYFTFTSVPAPPGGPRRLTVVALDQKHGSTTPIPTELFYLTFGTVLCLPIYSVVVTFKPSIEKPSATLQHLQVRLILGMGC